MLKSYVVNSVANEEVQICGTRDGIDLTIMSVLVNGGEEGGNFTLKLGDYQEKYTLDADDTMVLDHKIMLGADQTYSIIAEVNGISVCVSAVETPTVEE